MLIIQEALGFNAIVSGESEWTQKGAMAVAGCDHDENSVMYCPDGPTEADNPNHASLEVWLEPGWYQSDFAELNVERTPYYFDAGYSGEEGQYVNEAVFVEAKREAGMHLDFYGDFDADWREPWLYFDNHTSIPSDRLLPCSDTDLENRPTMSFVQRFTPDPDGFSDDGLAICEDGYWWLSPACRDAPSRCVPFVTAGNGWLLSPTLQRAIAYNMPIAVTTASTFDNFLDLVRTRRVTYYNWEPSLQFLKLNPKKIIFPYNDPLATAQGDKRTQGGYASVKTAVNPRLKEGSLRVHQFLSNMQLAKSQLSTLLSGLLVQPGDYSWSACDWLLNNSDTWRAWIPSATQCGEGEGLIDDNGEFLTDRSNATGCGPCKPGLYSVEYTDGEGTTSICSQCAPGTSQGAFRADSCEECDAGYFQKSSGQSVCERCPQGSYAAGTGNSACASCPNKKTTAGTGYSSLDDCVCPKNTFELPGTGQCYSCGDGAVCNGFSSPPEAAVGYYLAEVSASGLSIFNCGNKAVRCPGGVLGTCANNRRGDACSECVEGTTPSSDGGCSACSSGDYVPALSVAVGFAIALSVLYIGNSQEWSQRQSHTALFVVAVMAQLLSVLQMVGVISRISVEWPDPMKSLVDFFQRVTFELDDMVNIGCLAPVSALVRYCSKLTLVPVICVYLFLMHSLVSLVVVRRSGWWREKLPAVVSSVGIVVMAFYITISTLILTPFQCMNHPNGLWTLIQYPSVACWDSGEHDVMVIVGVLAAIIPVSFLVAVAFILRDFPFRMARGDLVYLKMFAFILIRVKPERRWYIWMSLCRNLALVCVPSIPDAFQQTLILQVIFVVSLTITVRQMPWKVDLANWLDIVSTFAVLFVLLTSAAFLGVQEGDSMSRVAMLTLIAVFCTFPLGLLWLCASRFFNVWTNRKPYRWFLCHHKGSSGSLARLLKLALTNEASRQGGKVFLDVDDLRDLAHLFLTVRYDVRTVLVIASAEVFRSPWCLGEVTTAFLHGVDSLPMYGSDFRLPESRDVDVETQLQRLDQLVESDLSEQMMKMAIDALRHKPGFQLPDRLDGHSLSTLVNSVISRDGAAAVFWPSMTLSGGGGGGGGGVRGRTSSNSSTSSTGATAESDVLLLVDHSNLEASSAALAFVRIANVLLPPDPSKMPHILGLAGDRRMEARPGGGPLVLILFFTSGCFNSRDYLSGLVEAVFAQVSHVLPVVASDNFQFPSTRFYDDLEANMDQVSTTDSSGSSVSSEILTPFLQTIFNRICPRLSVASSSDVLHVQIQLVVRALMDKKALALAGPGQAGASSGARAARAGLRAATLDRGAKGSQYGWRSTGSTKLAVTVEAPEDDSSPSSESIVSEKPRTDDYMISSGLATCLQI